MLNLKDLSQSQIVNLSLFKVLMFINWLDITNISL